MTDTNTNVTETIEVQAERFDALEKLMIENTWNVSDDDFRMVLQFVAKREAEAEAKGIEKAANVYRQRRMNVGANASVSEEWGLAHDELLEAENAIRALIKENG